MRLRSFLCSSGWLDLVSLKLNSSLNTFKYQRTKFFQNFEILKHEQPFTKFCLLLIFFLCMHFHPLVQMDNCLDAPNLLLKTPVAVKKIKIVFIYFDSHIK